MKKTHLVFSKDQIISFTKTFTIYNMLVVGVPFVILWGGGIFNEIKDLVEVLLNKGIFAYLWMFVKIYFWIITVIIGGVILHEIIHALVFMVFAKNGFESIEFGFIEKPFIPYVHCKEKLKLWEYRLGVVLPGLILGLVPCLLGLWLGNPIIIFIGIFFSSSAAGDLLLLKATKGIDPKSKIRDLPDQMGFEVFQ